MIDEDNGESSNANSTNEGCRRELKIAGRVLVNAAAAVIVTAILGFLEAGRERSLDPSDMAGLGGGAIVILSPVVGAIVAVVTLIRVARK